MLGLALSLIAVPTTGTQLQIQRSLDELDAGTAAVPDQAALSPRAPAQRISLVFWPLPAPRSQENRRRCRPFCTL